MMDSPRQHQSLGLIHCQNSSLALFMVAPILHRFAQGFRLRLCERYLLLFLHPFRLCGCLALLKKLVVVGRRFEALRLCQVLNARFVITLLVRPSKVTLCGHVFSIFFCWATLSRQFSFRSYFRVHKTCKRQQTQS